MTMVVRFSLASRTLLWVLLTSALLTALATVWVVNVERERMIEAAHADVRSAVAGRLAAIAGAVWAYDEETLTAILNGLINANSIHSVRVTGVDLSVEAVRPGVDAAIDANWSTALLDPSGKREIGRIDVFETHATLQQLLEERLTLLAITEILTMLALTVVLFVIVNYQITRHLRAVASAVTRLTESDQKTAISLARPARAYADELDVVVNAINQFSDARHQAEAALLELNRELEHRIEERTLALRDSNAELAEARDAANAASQTKSDFLANMSHEIRTPLNAIIGMSSLAERTELTAQQRGYISKTHAAAEALLGIINDMLDFSKIEAGKLELEQQPFLLDDVVEQVTSLVAFRAHDKQLEFLLDISPEVPPGLIGDALRLNQVLLNLCNNAIKFTHQGEVVLRIELAQQRQAAADPVALRFTVRDSGIGISAAQLGKLFQPFSQADASMTRQFGGTGLGLAICRQLVSLMGGEIGVSSEPGVGSEFWFEIVLPVAHQVTRGERLPLLENDRQRLRVLVVDDHQTARVITGKLLSILGFAHSWVDGGDEALVELQRAKQAGQPYNLVMLDWQQSAHDGMALLAKIRTLSRDALPPIRVMLFSAAHEALAAQSGANGFDGYLAKPATLSSLLDAILSVCGTTAVAPPPPTDGAKPEGIRWRILQGSRVLLVEDNELNQQLAIEILKLDAGIQVSVAHNGREAVARLQQQPNEFDAVLMDIQMPELDGYQATQQIRENLGLTELPIIAMTAHAMSQETSRCFAAGMNDFVSKPFLPDTLLSTLSRWIRPASGAMASQGNGSAGGSNNGSNNGTTNGAQRGNGASAASSNAAAGTGAELAGLDTSVGINYCRGKLSLYRNVLQVFMDTRQHSANEIQTALQQNELATANRIAHTVKSVAGTVGALRLARAAGELELAFSNNERSQFEPLLAAFTAALSETLALGRAYLQQPADQH